jgi:hypothetical protein
VVGTNGRSTHPIVNVVIGLPAATDATHNNASAKSVDLTMLLTVVESIGRLPAAFLAALDGLPRNAIEKWRSQTADAEMIPAAIRFVGARHRLSF